MIEICRVSKSYNRGQVKAVDDVSLTVQGGEIFGFLGPNGAGKTTLIKMITGILNADRGSIKINGRDIKDSPLEAKMQFGFVPDDPNIFSRLTGIEYLNFMADVYQVSSEIRVERIQKLLERFEMSTAAADLIQSYSHGMKQKIVVIGALLHNPPVWILDEPMTGLDPRSSYDLKEMMREHADAGKTVFFSTHVLEVAEKVCDRLAIINKGRVIFCGRLEEIRTHARGNRSLENLFLELTENA
ncbi:ABC transporter ATP-binding protein [Syntrophomonas wolfei]|jgi:ABC-2 type transport system ATP-binding protein|uniref:ABC transporter ATP-binding protein n=1 Tax=Syntrophomonas wolfei TaxID=863 RepID=UPI0023F48DCD|nr:ABC transporter ATP-binding protein [Syntrophomonas wolfei]